MWRHKEFWPEFVFNFQVSIPLVAVTNKKVIDLLNLADLL